MTLAPVVVIQHLTSSFSFSLSLILSSVFCLPFYSSLSLTHSEMLKLAASISAPALAPKASEQEAEDASKTSLSNAHAHACTQTHTHRFFFYSHSFFLTCTVEHTQMCSCSCDVWMRICVYSVQTSHTHTHTQNTGHSGPSPLPTLPVLCAFLCKQVTLNYFHLSEWERQAGTWTGSSHYHFITVIHCVKGHTLHARVKECAYTHWRMRILYSVYSTEDYNCDVVPICTLFYWSSQHTQLWKSTEAIKSWCTTKFVVVNVQLNDCLVTDLSRKQWLIIGVIISPVVSLVSFTYNHLCPSILSQYLKFTHILCMCMC